MGAIPQKKNLSWRPEHPHVGVVVGTQLTVCLLAWQRRMAKKRHRKPRAARGGRGKSASLDGCVHGTGGVMAKIQQVYITLPSQTVRLRDHKLLMPSSKLLHGNSGV